MMIAQSILLFMAGIATASSLGYGTLEEHEYDRPGPIDADIREMVNKMTLFEKVGQMTQLNQDLIFTKDGQLNTSAVAYYAKNYHVGSYLNQLARYSRTLVVRRGILTLFSFHILILTAMVSTMTMPTMRTYSTKFNVSVLKHPTTHSRFQSSMGN